MSFLIRKTMLFGLAICFFATAETGAQEVTRVIKLQNPTKQKAGEPIPNILTEITNPAEMEFEEINPANQQKIAEQVKDGSQFLPGTSTNKRTPSLQNKPIVTSAPTTAKTIRFSDTEAAAPTPTVNQAKPTVGPKVESAPGTYQFQQVTTQNTVSQSRAVQSSPTITTEIVAPRFVNIGRKATIQVKLTNSGNSTANGVKLIALLPENSRFVAANPVPIKTEGQQLTFEVPQIDSRRAGTIRIDLIPTAKESFNIETQVVLENRQQIAVSVREPTLKLDIDGDTEAILGKWTKRKIQITNTGDGIAENVQLKTVAPAEVDTTIEPQSIRYLQPGHSATFEVSTLCNIPGEYEMEYQIHSIGASQNLVAGKLRVYQPEIRVAAQGPNVTFVKHSGLYAIAIENVGEIAVNDVEVILSLPSGIRISTVSRQASVNPQTGQLVWRFDKIPAKSSQLIQMKGLALATGSQVCKFMVRSAETNSKEIQIKTRVASRADVKIGISNPGGPVRAGTKTRFSIEVENRGSGLARNVRVHAELPASTMPIAGDEYHVNQVENAIHFAAIDLKPGEKKTLTFEAVGVDQGEHVIRGVLQLGETQRRIIAEDSIFVFETDEAKITEALKAEVRR